MVINDPHWCENMPMTASRTLTFGVGGAGRKCPGDWLHRLDTPVFQTYRVGYRYIYI